MSSKKVLFTVVAFLFLFSMNSYGVQQPSKKWAAIVNGEKILLSTIDYLVSKQIQQDKKRGRTISDKYKKNLQKEWVDTLIRRILLFQESVKVNISVTEQEVDDALIALQKQGLKGGDDALRVKLKEDISIDKYIEKYYIKSTTISQDEIENYYNSNAKSFVTPKVIEVNHITKKVEKRDSEEIRKRQREQIEFVLKEVKKGESSFADLARKYSDAPSAKRGGNIGYIRKGQLNLPDFEKKVFTMKKGDVSDVVKSRFGYHVIYVSDVKEAGRIPLLGAKEGIEEKLRSEIVEKKVDELVAALRKKAEIQINLKGAH